ncbi:cupin domain-containing protein [Roseivirga sp. E12]|uniref:cupin domain-containing protein n=1 Tax=Roseivirga sp. E12 TaxID=2819237 RepID=UPI001ABD258E|nr:cupin domain-containing protein [Roseivirga sp. E12]MBO3697217.1 cupin domain-containing protein [Roseivirga sp. E12]
MDLSKKTILQKFEQFQEQWKPHIIGELNGQQVKLAKLQGAFVWHSHEHEDEYFQVFKGKLFMEFRDRTEVLEAGDMIIVPKGVEHNPFTRADEEVWVLLFEPASTKHTGEVVHERTHNDQKWI